MVRRPQHTVGHTGKWTRGSWLEMGVPWWSSQREKSLRGKEWALAETSTLTNV